MIPCIFNYGTTFLGIVGLVLTYVLYRLGRIKRYPSVISYTVPKISRVLQHVKTSLGELSLKYQDSVIKRDLYYVEVLLFNTRKSDIGLPDSVSSIKLCLPKELKWVDLIVKDESEQVGSSILMNDENKSDADLNFYMLRVGEYVRLEGLVESTNNRMIQEDTLLSLQHRIKDLDKPQFIPYISDIQYHKSKKSLRRILIWIVALIGVSVASIFIQRSSRVLYKNKNTGEVVAVSIKYNDDIVVDKPNRLSVAHGGVISPQEFEDDFIPVLRYQKSYSAYFNAGLFLLLIIAYSFLAFDECRSVYRHTILKKIESKNKKK